LNPADPELFPQVVPSVPFLINRLCIGCELSGTGTEGFRARRHSCADIGDGLDKIDYALERDNLERFVSHIKVKGGFGFREDIAERGSRL
jgi:hypothetical protein